MSINSSSVTRTWRASGGDMVYRMEAKVGDEIIAAEIKIPLRTTVYAVPPEQIEHDLSSKIIGQLRSALFPRP